MISSGPFFKFFRRFLMPLLMIVLFFTLSACKEKLYTGLSEREVNEMLAVLLRNGISSEKMVGEENTFDLYTDTNDIAVATEILKYNGYPQNKYKDIGDLFKKEGLISSPLEERVRFIYALSQEIADTISNIQGVISARVQIVLPDNNPLSDNLVPSSASVFIKHREDAGIESQILKIKELVVNSIEGLDYKNVSVALFPVQPEFNFDMEPEYVHLFGIKLSSDSMPRFKFLSILLVLLITVLFGSNIYLYMTSGRNLKENKLIAKALNIKQKVFAQKKKKKK